MPITNLGKIHITATQQQQFNAALATLQTIAAAITENLSADERRHYKRINEKNKLLVNKVSDYHRAQPALQSPDVDWEEFDLDYADRQYAGTSLNRLESVMLMMSNFKMVHDYDNYQDALRDYEYTMYKEHSGPGYEAKRRDVQQFFPAAGSTRKKPSARKLKESATH